MSAIRRLWRNHSLTIVLACIGMACIVTALQWEPGTIGWDLWLGFGQGTLTVALFYALSGKLRERNKPED